VKTGSQKSNKYSILEGEGILNSGFFYKQHLSAKAVGTSEWTSDTIWKEKYLRNERKV
jgi:hypothetical protein